MEEHNEENSTPPHPTIDTSQMGNQNLLMLQQMVGMIQNTMAQNRLETEHVMTRTRLEIEKTLNEKFASRFGEGFTPPDGTNKNGNDRTDGRTPSIQSDKVSFKTFKTCGATEFDGVIDPLQGLQWVKNIEKVFRISHCHENDKATYATAMLTNSALDWWEGIYDSMSNDQQQNLNWNQFKEKFLKQYCPADLQDKYAIEFLELKQGTMTVSAYLSEFLKRSKFATEYIATESKKVDRFVYGLRIEIREHLDGRGIPTLEQAAEQARRREDILAIKNSESNRQTKRTCPSFSPKSSTHNHFEYQQGTSSQNQSYNQTQMKSQSSKVQKCARCGMRHQGSCDRAVNNSNSSIVCTHCGQPSHIAPNCS